MHTAICDLLDIEYPIFAFSHCRDVVVEISRAGGFGVLGAAAIDPDDLEAELRWIDERLKGRPYGIDLVLPVKYEGDDEAEMRALIPPEHIAFVDELMRRFGIPPRSSHDITSPIRGHVRARAQWEVALRHPVRLLASALGPAPRDIQHDAHERGIVVAGLVGAVSHAVKHVEAGTDIVIAQGTEAGGHAGEISTLVLVPQVVDAIAPTPVLAAGGIADGRQIAAALALGAQGVWTGSLWLTTRESDTHPLVKDKLIQADSRDTVRSRCRTGKPVRQLRTPWVDAWEQTDAPRPLPAPLQQMLVRDATISMIEHGVRDPMGTPVGQVVGMMRAERPVAAVLYDLIEQYIATLQRMQPLFAEIET